MGTQKEENWFTHTEALVREEEGANVTDEDLTDDVDDSADLCEDS